jgi:general secretion pathway protein A
MYGQFIALAYHADTISRTNRRKVASIIMSSITASTESSTQLRIASIGKLNYLDFFGLSTPPFRNTADVSAFFLNESLSTTFSQIEAVLDRRENGLILVQGSPGAGKTTLIGQVIKRRMGRATAAWINRTLLTENEFLQILLHAFGIHADGLIDHRQLIDRFHAFLHEQGESGRPVILVVDEAQNLQPALIDLLPRLVEQSTGTQIRFHIILAGQDALEQDLTQALERRLNGFIRYQASLGSLDSADTGAYILHQLGAAGNTVESPFTEGAMSRIHQHTGGSMRLINTLCDFVLFNAYLGQIRQITPDLVQTTFNALQWEPAKNAAPESSAANAEPEQSLSRLILEYDNDREFALERETTTIGRAADNDLCIRDLRVSRYHARLTFNRKGFTIEDLGSTNGVYVNEERVKIRLLNDGDIVAIDDHRFRFAHRG